jgi:hypothetical protein
MRVASTMAATNEVGSPMLDRLVYIGDFVVRVAVEQLPSMPSCSVAKAWVWSAGFMRWSEVAAVHPAYLGWGASTTGDTTYGTVGVRVVADRLVKLATAVLYPNGEPSEVG